MSRTPTPPLGRNPFLGKQTRAVNRAIEAINDFSSIGGDVEFQRGPLGSSIELPGGLQPPLEFYGVIVSTGPSGEADYTDARYWVQSVDITQAAYADINAIASPYVLTLDYWVSATNLAEVVAGTHTLPTVGALDPTSPTTASVVSAGGTLVRVKEIAASKLTSNINDCANKVFVLEPIPVGTPSTSVAYLTQVGGSNGSTTSYPTYTYNIYFDVAKTQLAGGTLTVQAHRMLMVPVTAATLGIIQRDTTGSYALMAVLDEYPASNPCT